MADDEKYFFQPGDTVTLRQDIPNRPVMLVVRKEMSLFRDTPRGVGLNGLRCRWFSADGKVQEAVYSTKDLKLVRRGSERDDG